MTTHGSDPRLPDVLPTLPDYVELHARQRPREVAAVEAATRRTWSELWQDVERTAGAMQHRGVGKGSVVAVRARPTLAFLVTVAMVAQVVMTRFTNQKINPARARLQPPAGLAVVGLLAWKLAAETSQGEARDEP